ncbi:MAG: type II toxin-antitoxin system VapC family toxin [Dehalococcoidia bacterium]
MNRNEWFVDAGYWLALVNSKDRWHAIARWYAAGLRRPLVTTEGVLLEVGNALSKERWRALGIAMLAQIRAHPQIEIVVVDSSLAERALALYSSRQDKEWGLTDCISFVVMQERGITDALSADQHFVQAGFRALLREA